MSSKKIVKKKNKSFKNIQSLIPGKIKLNKIKTNPLDIIEKTKKKLGNFYSNLKKDREKEEKRLEKKRKYEEKQELQRQKKQAQKEKLDQIREEKKQILAQKKLILDNEKQIIKNE